jgi:acetolactate synthase-1/2/3 large subunit
LSIRQVSYNWKTFAREAFKMQVDIDAEEFKKPFVTIDLPVCWDLRLFLEEAERCLDAANHDHLQHRQWLSWCKERVVRYPVLLQRHCTPEGPINPYYFYYELFRQLNSDDIIACANGAASVIPFQVSPIKKGQRLFTNAGAASMGYELPAAIGAAVAAKGQRVICLAGDGSIQLNIQELQTIVYHNFNIKIFVLNNGGYLSIRSTQANFFQGNYVGESERSGVSFPDILKVGEAYGITVKRIDKIDFHAEIEAVLNTPGPVICEVVVDDNQQIEPKLSSRQLPNGRIVSPPLEDLYPFLNRDELKENMLIPVWEEDL